MVMRVTFCLHCPHIIQLLFLILPSKYVQLVERGQREGEGWREGGGGRKGDGLSNMINSSRCAVQ